MIAFLSHFENRAGNREDFMAFGFKSSGEADYCLLDLCSTRSTAAAAANLKVSSETKD
jgi:hypothetical protein